MFDKKFFDELPQRLQRYFQRFPGMDRVGVVLTTHQAEFLLVEILEYDEQFIMFAYWPRENADLPDRWDDVRNGLSAVTIPYQDIRSIEFDPSVSREREIGFHR